MREINKRLDENVLEIIINKFEKKSLKNTIYYNENINLNSIEE